MRNVEHTCCAPDSAMFLHYAYVLDGHLPASERNEASAKILMVGVKWSQLEGSIRHPASILAGSAVIRTAVERLDSAVVAKELRHVNV
jgi:hypothetical protein